MSEKGIKEKIEDIIEKLLSAILVGIDKDVTSELSWKIVHNNIKDLSILMRIQGRLGKKYPNKKENMMDMDMNSLVLLSLMNKKPPFDMDEFKKAIKYPTSIEDDRLWQEIFEILKKLKKAS